MATFSDTPDMEGIRAKLRKHLDGGVSQAAVARAIGMSAPAVNQFVLGKYNGDNEAVAKLIDSYLRKTAEREIIPQEPSWRETKMAGGVIGALHTAAIRRKIAVIVGDPGLGKTMTIQAYAERYPDTIVVTAHEGISGAKGLINQVLAASKIRGVGGRTLDAQLQTIIGGLRGTSRLIIVDDCQTLHVRSLECLRYIHDTARVGLALCGNWSTHPLLTAQGAGQFAQLFSRISCVHYMDPKEWDVEDVGLIARSACPDLDDEQVAFLHAILGAPLCDMRTVGDIIYKAMTNARGAGASRVSMTHLRNAAKESDRAREIRSHLPKGKGR